MFCAHCEETIRKALMGVSGVRSAGVSWEREQAVVRYDPERTDEAALRRCIGEAGYAAVSSGETRVQTVSVLVLLLALYVIANRTGLAQVFLFFPRAEASLGLGALFVTGLLTSVHCIAMCGGINLTQKSDGAAVTAMQEGDRQTLRTEIDYGSYPSVRVRAGIPVDWTLVVPDGKLNGCNGELRIPAYDLDIVLAEGENHVSLLPQEAGIYPYSCWMGMIQATIEVTDE